MIYRGKTRAIKGDNRLSKTYNLFISHSWSYSNHYNNLIDLLDNRPYFSYKNFSVPQDDPIHTNGTDKELYKAIYNKISPCHVILIVAGVYSTYSKWIDKEIKIAKNEFAVSKPILAIKPHGYTNVSTTVKNNCDELVNWNTESIINAIRKLS